MDFHQFDQDFWVNLENLITTSAIVIDRPKGSQHPRFPDFIYPVDYGYLTDTRAMDGHGIDIWVGTATPRTLDTILCTIDSLKKDAELKILYGCSVYEQELIYRILNVQALSALFIRR